jgi:hypothetical protein
MTTDLATLLARFIQERPEEAAAMMMEAAKNPTLSADARDIARLQHAYLTDPGFRTTLSFALTTQRRISMPKRCQWTVTVEVADRWIADGFNPDCDKFTNAIMAQMLGYATEEEVTVTLDRYPTDAEINAAMERVDTPRER